MSLLTPLPLAVQIAAQRWKQCQIYGILPDRQIRLYLVCEVREVSIETWRKPGVFIAFNRGFMAASDHQWTEWAPDHLPYRLPSPVSRLRLQPIGPHRLAIIAPGAETTTCILFSEDDDGRQDEIFPGFTFGPIDLDQIARTITTDPITDPEQPTSDTIA